MSWNASGQIQIDADTDYVDLVGLNWIPEYESLDESQKDQADYLLDVIREAAQQALLDGNYSVSMNGHAPPDNASGRSYFAFSLNPIA